MALFGPDARARRCLFVGVKRTSLKNAPRTAFDPELTFGMIHRRKKAPDDAGAFEFIESQ
jgi:hypothetical protein